MRFCLLLSRSVWITSRGLKILVSAVQFRPQPPLLNNPIKSGCFRISPLEIRVKCYHLCYFIQPYPLLSACVLRCLRSPPVWRLNGSSSLVVNLGSVSLRDFYDWRKSANCVRRFMAFIPRHALFAERFGGGEKEGGGAILTGDGLSGSTWSGIISVHPL